MSRMRKLRMSMRAPRALNTQGKQKRITLALLCVHLSTSIKLNLTDASVHIRCPRRVRMCQYVNMCQFVSVCARMCLYVQHAKQHSPKVWECRYNLCCCLQHLQTPIPEL